MASKNNPNKIKIKRTIQRRPRTVKSSNRVVATVPKTGGVIHGGGGVSRKREKREEKKRRYDELRKLAEEGAFMEIERNTTKVTEKKDETKEEDKMEVE